MYKFTSCEAYSAFQNIFYKRKTNFQDKVFEILKKKNSASCFDYGSNVSE